MCALENPAFSFKCGGLGPHTFEVLSFTAEERLSSLYTFDILLISGDRDIDVDTLLQGLATFTLHPPFSGEEDRVYTGVVSSFACLHRTGERYVYRLTMQHKLWRLDQTRFSRVFLNNAPVDFLSAAMENESLFSGTDFDMRCTSSYRSRDFVCQYNESAFAFVSRWLEYLGIYYWFEHSGSGGSCVIADSKSVHAPLPGFERVIFSEPSGMQPTDPRIITHFRRESIPLPKEVRLKTYNPQKPSLDLTCTSPVKNNGNGSVYIYGDTFLSKEEGEALADIRAEELLCREHIFTGVSHNPGLCPGFTFTLEKHFRPDWNSAYLTTAVRHEGSQSRQVVRTYSLTDLADRDSLFYRNSFTCIPAEMQFRPERLTPWPKVAGALHAVIDAEGSGEYAVLDDQGRYKVLLPFDTAGRGKGKSSCWISMMQPYAGEGMGFHAPLHSNTEVLIIFLDGNPDLPVIAGAVPNPQTQSVVTDANATQVNLTSGSGYKFTIEDAAGSDALEMTAPGGQAYIRLGTPRGS